MTNQTLIVLGIDLLRGIWWKSNHHLVHHGIRWKNNLQCMLAAHLRNLLTLMMEGTYHKWMIRVLLAHHFILNKCMVQVDGQWFNDEQTLDQPRRIVRPPKRYDQTSSLHRQELPRRK
ncbi:hypothetical protein GQ457_08G018050 [Hibiscus cannabinus]